MQLTKDFASGDFECHCGRDDCTAPLVDLAFVMKLQRLRDAWGWPFRINSGCRCRLWNAQIGGSPVSQHLLGRAADLKIEHQEDGPRLGFMAEKAGMGGIGIYSAWVHVDDGPKGRRWVIK